LLEYIKQQVLNKNIFQFYKRHFN